ncbi:hypothetical protein C8A00DRAFT_11639 [Chaetomidium leptoderma]|uniref:Uncharacterized protein n=1 Tax=Chaetomidium leptoderma TaxID=669021 RepID=A0AAN7A118_9PEZI|nr:hypothetical protein C8A00DRAFT_11639 [Chaetomidium leptoderma]
MDPSFHEARQEFTKPKPSHSPYKLSKFQQQLRRNPYAQALATPVRRCPITSTSLPRFFFQGFDLRLHPETGKPWLVPLGLDTKVPDTATHKASEAAETGEEPVGPAQEPPPKDLQSEEEAAETGEVVRPAQESSEDVQAGEEAAEPVVEGTPNVTAKTGPSAYVLASQRLLQELQNPTSLYFKGNRRLFRMSDHGQPKLGAALNNANWRSDMDTVLLELMRRRIVEGLLHFATMVEKEDRKYLVKCELWNDVKRLKHRGCLVYLGLPEGAASSESAPPEYVPPRLSMMDFGPVRFGSKLVVHNLCELLGDAHVRQLRQESELLRDGSLFLLGRQATVTLQMRLWNLQGYMAWEEGDKTSDAGAWITKRTQPSDEHT